MPDIDVLAVLVVAVIALLTSGVYYGAFSGPLAAASGSALDDSMPPWKIGAELLRNVVLAAVVAVVAFRAEVDQAPEGLLLGGALWIGFPVVLWAGAIIHEGASWRLAAMHSGDWLVKLLVITAILSVWR